MRKTEFLQNGINDPVEMKLSPNINASFSSSSTLLESTLSMQHTFSQWENDMSFEQGETDLPLCSPILPQPALLHEPFRKRCYSEDTTFKPATEDSFSLFPHSCPSPDNFFSLWSQPNSNHCFKTEPLTDSNLCFKTEPFEHTFPSPRCHTQLLRRNSAPTKVSGGDFGKNQTPQQSIPSIQSFTVMPPILDLLSTIGKSKEATSNMPDSKSEADFFCQFDVLKELDEGGGGGDQGGGGNDGSGGDGGGGWEPITFDGKAQGSDFRNVFAVGDNMSSSSFIDNSFHHVPDNFGHFEKNRVSMLRDEPPKIHSQQQRCYRKANFNPVCIPTLIPSLQKNQIAKNSKGFSCDLCGKSFTQKGGLLNHIRIHTGERPFQCKDCGRGFTQKCNLTRHQRIHTGEKPYECHLCYRRFNRKWGLVVHLRAHENATVGMPVAAP